jgi:Na+-transporting NADH:ubiquinone oxidoreductase subunit C
MFAVTAFFSSIVIGFSQFTRERVEANENLAYERAVLAVLPGLLEGGESRLQVHNKFVERVGPPEEEIGGACRLTEAGRTIAYALRVEGQGFWAPIKGVIGIDADRRTITGIAFYEQNETPGLGAQITTRAFTGQFRGKVLSPGDRPLAIRPPGAALGESDVEAVTGATQTSVRLEKMLNDALTQWRSKLTEAEGGDSVR